MQLAQLNIALAKYALDAPEIKDFVDNLGSVDLCCSIFVLFERAFIAALDVWPRNLSEYRATMRKVRSKEPFGSA